MKLIIIGIPAIFLFSCNQNDSIKKKTDGITDTSISNKQKNQHSDKKTDSTENNHKKYVATPNYRKVDTALLMKVSTQILKYIKTRNYKKLALSIHPRDGIRFSPYANIDTGDDRVLSPGQLQQLAKQNKPVNWHSSWDAEKPELMTIDQYFKRFVYINEVYPGCNVVEFFFPGFEEKYGGMDFRALRLVFKMENKSLYLIAIVHDEWTP
jgi:hypothetical protein